MPKIVNFIKNNILSILIITCVLLIAFNNINDIFFQQDEWFGLGNAFTYKSGGGLLTLLKASFLPDYPLSRYVPLIGIINYTVFNSLRTNTSLYGLLAFTLALLNTLLVYVFAIRFTKSKIVATFTSLLWVTNNLAVQSIIWIGTMFPSQFSFLFFLLSLIYILDFVNTKNQKKLYLSSLLILVSVMLKEQGIYYLIPFLLIIILKCKERWSFVAFVKTAIIVSIPSIIFIFLPRLLNSLRGYEANVSPSLDPSTSQNVVFNAFLLPARSMAHIFLNPDSLYKHIYQIVQIHYPKVADGSVIETMGGDVFSLLLSFYLIIAMLMTGLLVTKNKRKLILISLVSFFASTVPFILYRNENAILEPRYYTHLALWSSLALTICIHSFFTKIKIVGTVITVLLLSFILIHNISGIQKILTRDIKTGQYRKDILNTVTQIEPYLGNNNVFYFHSESSGFYEFQSGFGQTLAVWFFHTGMIPKKVLRDTDFWNPSYQGIKSYPEGKFGYFMTYDELLNGLKLNKDIKLEEVNSFYWDTQKHTVTNDSSITRAMLKEDLKN